MRSSIGIALALVLLAGCIWGAQPAGQSPPPANATPDVGVAYRMSIYCQLPLQVGSTWWQFAPRQSWPRALPHDQGTSPYPVPGILTLSSASNATFRADVDGSNLGLTKMAGKPPLTGCI